MDRAEMVELAKKYWWLPVGAIAAVLLVRQHGGSSSGGELGAGLSSAPAMASDIPTGTSGSSTASAAETALANAQTEIEIQKLQWSFWNDPLLPGSVAPETATTNTGRTPTSQPGLSRYEIQQQQQQSAAQAAQATVAAQSAAQAAEAKRQQDAANSQKNRDRETGTIMGIVNLAANLFSHRSVSAPATPPIVPRNVSTPGYSDLRAPGGAMAVV